MIVPVKKVQLAVLNDFQEELLQNLQRYGILMLIPVGDKEPVNLPEDVLLQRTEKSLRLIKEYQDKKEQTTPSKEIEYEEFMRFDENRQIILSKIEEYDQQINQLENEIKSLEETIAEYDPWEKLPIKLSVLGRTKYSVSRIGFINSFFIKKFAAFVEEYGGDYLLLKETSEGQAVAVVCYYEDEAVLFDRLKETEFQEVNLPKEDKTPAAIINEKKVKLRHNQTEIDEIKKELRKYSEKVQELELLNDQLATISELKQAPIANMPRTVYLEGWVRGDQEDILKRAIREVTDIYDLDISTPESDEMPPTVVDNNKFVAPFETITDMFAVPNPYEVDPNPALSFWFIFIFGMMMGDVGYGFVIFLFSFLYIKIKKPKNTTSRLIKIFLYSGLATVLWGVAYGSYFGFTVRPNLIEPMNDPLQMLTVSFIIGGLHIITGILLKAYHNFRNKKYLDMIFDQFTWIFVIVGAGLLFLPDYKTVGGALALTGGGLILIAGGRKSKGIFGKIFGGLGGLYNITGYLSDVLSYSRILALSLSTATIGWVMNMLAGMFTGSIINYIISGFIFLLGH